MNEPGESKKKTRSLVDVGRLWYAVVIWGCALLVFVLGFQKAYSGTLRTNTKVPAVGGYSTTQQSETSTVGILTQVEGKAYAKPVYGTRKKMTKLHLGSGLDTEHQFWVQEKSRIFLIDIQGNRFVVAGPAVFSITKQNKFKILQGSLFVETAAGKTIEVENTFIAATYKGQGALWTTNTQAQLFNLEGQASAWHQRLTEQKVKIEPGFFTQASTKNEYLQPDHPTPTDAEKAKQFLAQFGVENAHIPMPEYFRELASEGQKHQQNFQGSRNPEDVLNNPGDKVMKIFNAKLRGKDAGIDEDEDDSAASDESTLAQLPVAGTRSPASKKANAKRIEKPSLDVITTGEADDEEKENLLRKLRRKSFTEEL